MPHLFKKTVAPKGKLDFAGLKNACQKIKNRSSKIDFQTNNFLKVVFVKSYDKKELEKAVKKLRSYQNGKK
ncbi:hypothetical protein GF323_04980 [Candidatus Woesearchaeota archaeon]|nr:hypothetical protein [Candidatus Woesearchaeota archaeon]